MNRKKWAALTLSLLGLSIGGTVALVAAVDPFEVYHKATAFIPPISNGTQIYSNAGIAKNYAYDSVVIGSSMTENFRPSQLDRLFGGQFVKLCVNAGSSFNHKQMMDMAFATHDVRRVLYGVDVEALTYFYKTPKCEMPDYLYDDDLFNDVSYWFNKSVLLTYIPECLATLGQSDPGSARHDVQLGRFVCLRQGSRAGGRFLQPGYGRADQRPKRGFPSRPSSTWSTTFCRSSSSTPTHSLFSSSRRIPPRTGISFTRRGRWNTICSRKKRWPKRCFHTTTWRFMIFRRGRNGSVT